MAIPAILRGLSSLIPGLGGAAYVGSQKPEGIEEVFKAATGTAGISRASESLTKEINVKKVADRLKAAGVDPETADKIAQGAIGQFGDAVIGDDEASTIAQDIGRGLEGGKPSGSAMIDFGGEEERGKILRDPLITKPSEVGTEIKEGFSESEGIAQLPPFTEQEQQKVNVGDVGFTEAAPMPTILTAEEEKKSKYTLPEQNVNNFFETVGELETYNGTIEDYEMAYHGGVGDLGDNRAAMSIVNTEEYPDYKMVLEEEAERYLGEEFTAFRIANTKEVMSLLNNQKKNKIKSYTLNPRQAIGFGYMANEAFMDPITTYPRGDLVIIESPIKAESLVMRGRPEEAEVVTDTTGVSIKNSRIYNPYTGEVIYEPTKGSLVDKEPYQFERLLKTETKKSSFLDELKDKFTKKAAGGIVDKPLYDR